MRNRAPRRLKNVSVFLCILWHRLCADTGIYRDAQPSLHSEILMQTEFKRCDIMNVG